MKDLFSNDYIAQAGKGRLLYEWSRENLEMVEETWQAHTDEDTKKNFQKPAVGQDPFFGSTPIFKRLMQRANEIRYPSRFLALDEEIVFLLGKCGVTQYNKDKNIVGDQRFSVRMGVTSKERPSNL